MYTKLFSSLTDSTIWREPNPTRILWITMLSMADKHGEVQASIPGLADRARLSLDETLQALEKLASPDTWSRSHEYEGRRIQEIGGGWKILNHGKYSAIKSDEERREYMRKYMQERRKHSVNSSKQSKDFVNSIVANEDKAVDVDVSKSKAGEAPPIEPTPKNLHPLEYARKILEELNFPVVRGNLEAIVAAIQAEIKGGNSLSSAYEFVLAGAKDAQDEGIEINRFFFTDAKYRSANRKPSANGGRCQKHPGSGLTQWGSCWQCYAEKNGGQAQV